MEEAEGEGVDAGGKKEGKEEENGGREKREEVREVREGR